MHKPPSTRLPRSSCDLGGRFHVHRMKLITSVLNVETDRVNNAVGTSNGCLHGALVMCVRSDLLDCSVLARPAMPRDYADPSAGVAQVAHNTTANKASSAKHCDTAQCAFRRTILWDASD